MKCDICRKQQAVFFVRTPSSELHLCEACAKKQGFSSSVPKKTNESESTLINIFAGILNTESSESNSAAVCPHCGISRLEIRKTGRVGCAYCYTQFSADVAARRRSEGGFLSYTGSMPDSYETGAGEEVEKQTFSELEKKKNAGEIKALREELRLSVEREDYENAACIRDRLRDLEGKSE